MAAGGFFLAVQHNLNIGSEPDHPALDIFDSLDVLENFLGRFFGIRNSGDDNSSGHVVLLSQILLTPVRHDKMAAKGVKK